MGKDGGRGSMRMGAGFRIIGEGKKRRGKEACLEVNEEWFLKLSLERPFCCILKAGQSILICIMRHCDLFESPLHKSGCPGLLIQLKL